MSLLDLRSLEESASGGGTVALTAVGLTTAAATLGAPALGQRHVLVAVGVQTSGPTLGGPILGQRHVLAALGVQTSAPTLGAPTLRQAHVLLAAGVATGAPSLATAAFAQRHALAGVGLATGAATLGSPALGSAGTVALSAAGLDTAAPTLDAPALSEHTAPAPVDEAPRRGLNLFTPARVTARPVVLYALSADDLTTLPPTLGRPSFLAARSRAQVQRRRAIAALVC